MPAYVEIEGNEATDELVKEARDLNNSKSHVTLDDANAITRYRLKEKTIKVNQQLCEIDSHREIPKTITRLRTGHFGSMKINVDNRRTYE
ncbi:hypothetical protein TNIN_160841 [Trichonephila inaurata madagascariensis]|uniref:RNase H type-1 domain-containing protein n=1 Tax=Trichonephila inaurata madagascariensis TaxID=2747483 RepID=A0A8X6YD98_9ARAC|nr:hypothetical protein TNIN_368461 [Trichonephila inaurata madagascariensis]GFY68533.1 hypothetical protein TNIN_160841 [Trichonephila inaurata madagascariensis]